MKLDVRDPNPGESLSFDASLGSIGFNSAKTYQLREWAVSTYCIVLTLSLDI